MLEILSGCFSISPYKLVNVGGNKRLPLLSKLNGVTPGFRSIQVGLGLISSGIDLSGFGYQECFDLLLKNGIDQNDKNRFLVAIGILFSKSITLFDSSKIGFLDCDELMALNAIKESVYLASVGISADDIRSSIFADVVNPNDFLRFSVYRAIEICCLSKSYSDSIYECIGENGDLDIISTVYSALHHFFGGKVSPSVVFAVSFAIEKDSPIVYWAH